MKEVFHDSLHFENNLVLLALGFRSFGSRVAQVDDPKGGVWGAQPGPPSLVQSVHISRDYKSICYYTPATPSGSVLVTWILHERGCLFSNEAIQRMRSSAARGQSSKMDAFSACLHVARIAQKTCSLWQDTACLTLVAKQRITQVQSQYTIRALSLPSLQASYVLDKCSLLASALLLRTLSVLVAVFALTSALSTS